MESKVGLVMKWNEELMMSWKEGLMMIKET